MRRLAPIAKLPLVVACFLAGDIRVQAEQLFSAAVDAGGKRHVGHSDMLSLHDPWDKDRVKFASPEYPYEDRSRSRQGAGLFRALIDLQTGSVTQVTILKSTGYPTLDASAVASIRTWRWRPHTWKTVDTPVAFVMRSR